MSGYTQPAILLIETQLGENIGMCARAMLNCGLTDLRLVRPRVKWPNTAARATASGADEVLDAVRIFDSVDAALEDCQLVLATSSRTRGNDVPVWDSGEAAEKGGRESLAGRKVGILFGPEASGLDNEAVSRADVLLKFSTNPEFASLNLAQCVLLVGWEWKKQVEHVARHTTGGEAVEDHAPRAEVEVLARRFEEALDQRGFFLTPELKPHTQRTLRHLLFRLRPSPRELKFLHGVLSALLRG